ncbi:unnamed protein product [Fusarium graminearum]|nr:unnamed protein product [Fusarium graminearum]
MAGSVPPDGPWGVSWSDFRVHATKRTRSSSPTYEREAQSSRKKRNRANHARHLPNETDELHQFIQDLDDDVSTDLCLMGEKQQEEEWEDEEEEEEEEEEEGDEEGEEENATLKNVDSPRPERMEIAYIDSLISEMENVCGPPLTLESLPEILQDKIQQHDDWYISMLEDIFKQAGDTSQDNTPFSLFSPTMLVWLKANSDERTRNALISLLLHPHVRSLRCRAAMGHRNTNTLLNILEFHELRSCGEEIPNVIGTYFIHGELTEINSAGETDHIGYSGQALSIKPDKRKSVGIRQRARSHWKEMMKFKLDPNKYKDALHMYHRLEGVDKVELAVLSVFPFPQTAMGNASRHLYYIASLAETIDILLLDCVNLVGKPFGHHSALPHGMSLRPKDVPLRSFEGLNRALPIKQMGFGPHLSSVTWSPKEICRMIEIINQHEDQVYLHFVGKPIQWEFLAEKLRSYRILKTIDEIKSLYAQLVTDSSSGILTYRASQWRYIWKNIYNVKEHLIQKDLVRNPRDDNDMYYHIPALEEGIETTWHIRDLLRRTEFAEVNSRILDRRFFQCYLARLLQRDVWEKIQEEAPDRLVMKQHRLSPNLLQRTKDVLLHLGEEIPNEDVTGIMAPSPCPDVGRSSTLRADSDSCCTQTLAPWTYKSSEGATHETSPPVVFSNYGHIDPEEIERQDVDKAEPNASFAWGSDWDQHEALGLSNAFVAAESKFPTKTASCLEIPVQHEAPAEIAQHRSSTLRLLMHIMRKFHQSTFESADGTYKQFWEVMYIGGLDKRWRIDDIERRQNRDSWLNPDLSPSLVKAFLTHEGCLEEVSMGIQASMPGININGFCDAYGVMMAWIWEKAMRSYSTAARFQDCYSFETDVPLSSTAPTLLVQPERAKTPTLPDFESMLPFAQSSRVDSPIESSPSEDPTVKFDHKRWEIEEIDFLKHLLKTGDKKPVRYQKFIAKFGPVRSESSVLGQERKLKKDMGPREKTVPWTTAESGCLIGLMQTQGTWAEVVKELNTRFNNNNNRTISGIKHHSRSKNVGALGTRGHAWTDQEDAELKSLREKNVSLKEIPGLLDQKFGTSRTYLACKRRATTMAYTNSTFQPFTTEEDDQLREYVTLDLKPKEMSDRFWKRFGTRHSRDTIAKRIRDMGPAGSAKKRAIWTAEETQFLQDWLHQPVEGRDVADEFRATFGLDRSGPAIRSKFIEVRTRAGNKGSQE